MFITDSMPKGWLREKESFRWRRVLTKLSLVRTNSSPASGVHQEKDAGYRRKKMRTKEEIARRRKKYYQEHKKEISLREKKRRDSNREEFLIKRKQYRLKNKDKIAIKVKEYENKHKDKLMIYHKKYKELHHDKRRTAELNRAHGIILEEYDEMLLEQNGCCAICGIHYTSLKKRLGVDHDHNSGIIRGLLCNKCNIGLGMFKDNIESLMNAIKYLNRFVCETVQENQDLPPGYQVEPESLEH